MNTERNYGRNTLQTRSTQSPGFKTNTPKLATMKNVFENYSVQKLNKINKIKLQNYYRNNPNEPMTCCLICEVNIDQNDIYEHHVSLTHDFNKLFYNFVQERNKNGDMDFVILDAKWVRCRYCNNVQIPKESYELRNDHAQDLIHSERKQYCLNRVTGGSANLPVTQQNKNSPDLCVNALVKNLSGSGLGVSNEHKLAAGSSTGITGVSNTKNLERKEYCLNTVTRSANNPVTAQRASKVPDPSVNTRAKSLGVNGTNVTNTQQWAATSSGEITGNRIGVVNRIHDVNYPQRYQYSLNRVAGRDRNPVIEQRTMKAQDPYSKTVTQIIRDYRGENSARTSNERQMAAGPSREVTEMRRTGTSEKPYYRPYVHAYETSDSDSDDGDYHHRPVNNYHISPNAPRITHEDNTIATSVWIGIAGLLAWRYFRS